MGAPMPPTEEEPGKRLVQLVPDNPAVASEESIQALDDAITDLQKKNVEHAARLDAIELRLEIKKLQKFRK